MDELACDCEKESAIAAVNSPPLPVRCWWPWKRIGALITIALIRFQNSRWDIPVETGSQLYPSLDWQKYMDYFKDSLRSWTTGQGGMPMTQLRGQAGYYLRWYDLYGKLRIFQ